VLGFQNPFLEKIYKILIERKIAKIYAVFTLVIFETSLRVMPHMA